ncbi:uncharacterized protein (DUF2147 family) [Paucibacter oligotrophus]|uniref:Uncharacterized protein (DUF2147 family) n=1 Tax=Roseateles oligotrophus TaxID=1769250 RepID=A0A840LFG6_9BURK|nr:DUF2147 domain-containing protein [Roseateles oligotrophus]MBB4844948.1 uncharacterized protein (DUF2147 family) [Roseateles oligotrophus]
MLLTHLKFRRPALLALLLSPLLAAAAGDTPADDPRGRWVTANGNLEVEISACGKALCGKAVKLLGNRSMTPGGGEMKPVDGRPVLGMQILSDFLPLHEPATDAAAPAEREWRGQIYNRENGKSYACQMRVSTENQARGELVLHAYVGLPLFGKTQRWQRALEADVVSPASGPLSGQPK